MAVVNLVAKVDAQIATFQKNFAEASRAAQKFERDFGNTASSVSAQQKRITDAFTSFSGDKLAREALAVAKAVEQIGGASRLTAKEQAQVNAVVSEAIAKYAALGQTAPKSLVDLEAATRKLETTTATTQKTTGQFANSLEFIQAKGTLSGQAMEALTGTFGKFTLAGVAVGIVNKLGGELANMATQGTKIAPIQDAFERLAEGVGENSDRMLGAMQTATRGLVTNFDLMQSANKALLLGLNPTAESMATLGRTATTLGKAMGQDATKSLDDLVVALGRSSPLILDNLGLTVKVEEANRKYAASIGTTVDALDEQQKKQAFANLAMEKAKERVEQIGEQSLTLTEHAKTVTVTLSNIVVAAVGAVDRAAGQMITSAQNALERVAKAMASMGGAQNNPQFFDPDDLNQALQSFAENIPNAAKAADTMAEKTRKLRSDLNDLSADQRKNIEAGKALGLSNKEIADEFNKLGGKLKLTEQHLSVYADMQDKAKDATREHAKEAKRTADEIEKAFEGTRKVFEDYTAIIAKANSGIADADSLQFRKSTEFDVLRGLVGEWLKYQKIIDSVNSQIRLGIDSSPGTQFSGEVLAGIWGKDEQRTRERELKKAEKFGQDLSRTIIAAIAGGGDIGKAIGAQLGSSLGEELGKKVASSIGGTLGSTLGGALGPLGALGGSLVGGLLDKVFGKDQRRKDVEAFAQSFGGFDKLQKKLIETFDAKTADRFWRSLTQGGGNAKAVIDEITQAFDNQAEAMERAREILTPATYAEVTAAAERYGIEVNKLGDAVNNLRVTETAQQAVKDWQLLTKAGADMEEVARGMADEMQALVKESLEFGHSLPDELRPIIEKMRDMGLLTDTAGNKLTDLDKLNWDEPLQKSLADLETSIKDLAAVIRDELGGALSGLPRVGIDVPALGSGAIVRRPTLALVGESGPEAVVPLGGGAALSGRERPIVVQTFLDGRQVAEVTAEHLPHVLQRRGAA